MGSHKVGSHCKVYPTRHRFVWELSSRLGNNLQLRRLKLLSGELIRQFDQTRTHHERFNIRFESSLKTVCNRQTCKHRSTNEARSASVAVVINRGKNSESTLKERTSCLKCLPHVRIRNPMQSIMAFTKNSSIQLSFACCQVHGWTFSEAHA